MHATSDRVKQLIADRENAATTYASATTELTRLGCTIAPVRPPEAFTCIATFADGSTLQLYEGTEPEHTFADLKEKGMDKLTRIEWVSTFDGDNDNTDRRIHLVLDWATGQFSGHNIVSPQRFNLDHVVGAKDRELVIFRRRIVRVTAGLGGLDMAAEQYHYTLYGLGFRRIAEKDEALEDRNIRYKMQRVLLIDPLGGVDWA